MKRIIFIMSALWGVLFTATSQNIVDGVSVNDFKIERNGAYLVVDMNMDLTSLNVDGNRAVLLTPRLVNGSDSVELPSIGIYGRRRYYYYVRNGESMLTGESEKSYRAKEKPDSIPYNNIFAYKDWMDGAQLALHRMDYGCCNALVDQYYGLLGKYTDNFFPELVYMKPPRVIKTDSLVGSAFIDFPVDKVIIYPEYRNNVVELAKIQATIDSVHSDKDIKIDSVWLKGFASPESPYSHNTELAIGRTEALKKYIQQLYNFSPSIIKTAYVPENWQGLREYVVKSNISNREEILAIIDSNLEPDPREWRLKTKYPKEYRFLLQNCYPALRKTDYRIKYTIRQYNDIEEIKRIYKTNPRKLSIEELYNLSLEYEPGSDEFTEIFETAAHIYPNDTIANLNAANAAMRRGDNVKAAQYLKKAGISPRAVYARAALAIRTKEYDKARELLKEAQRLGVGQAAETLKQIDNGRK